MRIGIEFEELDAAQEAPHRTVLEQPAGELLRWSVLWIMLASLNDDPDVGEGAGRVRLPGESIGVEPGKATELVRRDQLTGIREGLHQAKVHTGVLHRLHLDYDR